MKDDSTGSVRDQVQLLLEGLLDMDGPIDWATVRYQETPEWDSLVQMAIVAELEARFSIQLTADEIFNLRSLDHIDELLSGKGIV
jgi:acyl carrier protein